MPLPQLRSQSLTVVYKATDHLTLTSPLQCHLLSRSALFPLPITQALSLSSPKFISA